MRVFFPLLVSDSESVTSPHHVIKSSCLQASMAYERLSATEPGRGLKFLTGVLNFISAFGIF